METSDFRVFRSTFTVEHPIYHTAPDGRKRVVSPAVAHYHVFKSIMSTQDFQAAFIHNYSAETHESVQESYTRHFAGLRRTRIAHIACNERANQHLDPGSIRHGAQGLRDVILKVFLVIAVYIR